MEYLQCCTRPHFNPIPAQIPVHALGVFQSFYIISMVAYFMQWHFINFQLSREAKRSFRSISFNYLAKGRFGYFLCILFIIFFPFISLSFLLKHSCHLLQILQIHPSPFSGENVIQTRSFIALIIGIHLCLNFFFRCVVLAHNSLLETQT